MSQPATSNPQTMNRRQFLQITAVTTAVTTLSVAALSSRRWWPKSAPTTSVTRTLMGTIINLAVVGAETAVAQQAIAATFAEMERLIALFDHRQPHTPLARLNQAGQLAAPPAELVALIQQAQEISALTQGAFDISVKPLVDAYRSGQPDAAARRALVNYRHIQADDQRIYLERPGMALTLDGIAKGWVVDGATAVLQTHGFHNILVEAGGDLLGLGVRADGRPWRVGLSHPRQGGQGLLAVLPVSQQAVATSGDYQHSFSQDFSQHHIIDPRTGLSPTDLASATLIAPTATLADALSTAVMVLGSAASLDLIARLPYVEALLVTKALEIRQTAGFPRNLESNK